jgi:hypothetical protein
MRVQAKKISLVVALVLVVSFGVSCAKSPHGLARTSIRGERYEEALMHLKKGASEGDKRCDYMIATLLFSGKLEGEVDPEAAGAWLLSAAASGLAEAQLDLGRLYSSGYGVEKDLAKAADWYRKSADAGVSEAQSNLGLLYGAGNGVEKDLVLAVELFQQAAEKGNPLGQGALGLALFEGSGISKNVVDGYMWTVLASEELGEAGEKKLLEMASEMTAAQRATAVRRAAMLRHKLARKDSSNTDLRKFKNEIRDTGNQRSSGRSTSGNRL